jgi:hypothetical protein
VTQVPPQERSSGSSRASRTAPPNDADRAGTKRPLRPSIVVRGAGRYEVLLVLLAAVLVLAPLVSTALQPLVVALLGVILVYAMWTSRAATSLMWVATGLALACVVTSAVSPVWSDSSRAASAVVSIILSSAAIATIAVNLTRRRTATSATLAGAVAIYVLVGLVFAELYLCLAELSGTAFFAQTAAPSPVAYVYFSYTTLTTVGFGDLTAVTDAGRMLAVTEALLGQLYLVTVVAFIVATRRPRTSS